MRTGVRASCPTPILIRRRARCPRPFSLTCLRELPLILESLLLASPDGLTLEAAARVIREVAQLACLEGRDGWSDYTAVTELDIGNAIAALLRHYELTSRSFTLVERATGWRLCARTEYADWIRGLFPEKKPARLTPPTLETLAVVAYRQPTTKAVIEAVRGVSVDGPLQTLLERGMVAIAGRADLPGRPMLYETTPAFLEHFGIRHADDMPNAEELRMRSDLILEEKPSEETADMQV